MVTRGRNPHHRAHRRNQPERDEDRQSPGLWNLPEDMEASDQPDLLFPDHDGWSGTQKSGVETEVERGDQKSAEPRESGMVRVGSRTPRP